MAFIDSIRTIIPYDVSQVKLDIARNKLLTASTLFTMVNLLLALASAVSGMFGVNLESEHKVGEPGSHAWFVGLAISMGVVFVAGNAALFLYFRRRGILVT